MTNEQTTLPVDNDKQRSQASVSVSPVGAVNDGDGDTTGRLSSALDEVENASLAAFSLGARSHEVSRAVALAQMASEKGVVSRLQRASRLVRDRAVRQRERSDHTSAIAIVEDRLSEILDFGVNHEAGIALWFTLGQHLQKVRLVETEGATGKFLRSLHRVVTHTDWSELDDEILQSILAAVRGYSSGDLSAEDARSSLLKLKVRVVPAFGIGAEEGS